MLLALAGEMLPLPYALVVALGLVGCADGTLGVVLLEVDQGTEDGLVEHQGLLLAAQLLGVEFGVCGAVGAETACLAALALHAPLPPLPSPPPL